MWNTYSASYIRNNKTGSQFIMIISFLATMTNRIHQLGILQSTGATPRQVKSTLFNKVVVLSLPASQL